MLLHEARLQGVYMAIQCRFSIPLLALPFFLIKSGEINIVRWGSGSRACIHRTAVILDFDTRHLSRSPVTTNIARNI